MKTKTIHQPFAFCVVAGLKPHETNSRRTNIRGRIAIHAAQFNPQRFWEIGGYLTPPQKAELDRLLSEQQGLPYPAANVAYGAIIGTVEIVDCVPVEEVVNNLSERERILGDYSPGRFAWVLKNPIMFSTPIPAKGKQGWWEWDENEQDAEKNGGGNG